MLRPLSFRHIISLVACIFLLAVPAFSQSTGGVKGKVRDWNGRGVSGITVSARQKGVEIKSVKSRVGGDFVLDGLASGVYNIAFDGEGYSTGVLYNVEVKSGKIRGLSERLLLTRDRGAQVFVKGIVFFRDNTSLAGADVELYLVNDDGTAKKIAGTTTDVMGDFSFPAVGVIRKMRVKASYKGVSEIRDIDVIQPQVYRTTIILPLDRPKEGD
jgi:hypothetical protein